MHVCVCTCKSTYIKERERGRSGEREREGGERERKEWGERGETGGKILHNCCTDLNQHFLFVCLSSCLLRYDLLMVLLRPHAWS